ncbi:hypothetical protein SLS56_002133 [Neofusicoccum ribis]|uniref:Prion-inhibition and propagation HeLo domain-containing protein n=1 Tax=Neofusicoccum ribis TaxID=45134 RepID=A0ABR3T583_9PEZI
MSGMEPAGLAVGVVGTAALFNNAVECFEYIQLGRNFGKDFGTSQLKLDNARLRLSRWGEAIQIYNAESLPPRETRQAGRNIGHILELFADAEGISKTFRGTATANTGLAVCDPHADMNEKALALHKQMRNLALNRQKHAGLTQKTKWALYQKKHFEELIENITDLVDGLEKILPAPQATQSRLCEEEISTIGTQADLPLLEEVAVEQDPPLVDAIRKVLAEQGRLPGVVFSGANNRGFQLGNNTGTISGFTFGGKD